MMTTPPRPPAPPSPLEVAAAAKRERARLEAEEAAARAEVERLRARVPATPRIEEARKRLASLREATRRAEHAAFLAERQYGEEDLKAARAALREATSRTEPAARERLDRLILEKQREVASARTRLLEARRLEKAASQAPELREVAPDRALRAASEEHGRRLAALEQGRAAERAAAFGVVQSSLAGLREALAAARSDRQALSVRVAVLAAKVRAAARAGGRDGEGYRAASQRLAEARGDLAAARAAERTAAGKVAATLGASLLLEPADEIARLSASYPITLFPVRIETRFAAPAAAAAELRVRIYPDEILAPTHDPRLTRSEVEAGQAYWNIAWDPANEPQAWSALVTATEPWRAAWIAREMTPTNAAARAGQPQFPAAYADPAAVPEGYAHRVDAALLPDRWLVVCYRGGKEVHRAVSGPVREPLVLTVTGDVPDNELVDVSGDGLRLAEDVLWTIDFARAEAAGMAVRVPGLTEADLDAGFDRVLVLGVKGSLAAEDAPAKLGELFRGHRHGSGLALVAQGTPTNNTGTTAAGYPPDHDATTSHAREITGLALQAESDGNRLLRALGLSADAVTELAPHLDGADRTEDAQAHAMNAALWPVTWGYTLEQLLDPELSAPAIEQLRRYFNASVRARGPLPAFRVGGVPYGVLPAVSLERWKVRGKSDGTDHALAALLLRLRELWRSRTPRVAHAGRTPDDPDHDLVEMLGLDASAREVRVRASYGVDFHRNLFGLLGIEDVVWKQWAETSWWKARGLLSILGLSDRDPRILGTVFDEETPGFAGPLVAPEPLSESLELQPNYIAWIARASVDELRAAASPPGWVGPVPLLYLLLRHAALLNYGSAALDLHQLHTREPISRRDAELVRIAPGTEDEKTVIDRLEATIPAVDPQPIKKFVRTPAARAAVPALGEYQAALQGIEGLTTAELERLMTETLDLASHRLDAWITSLASRRLDELRRQAVPGTHVGAFAWVENLRRVPAPIARNLKDGRVLAVQAGSGGHIQAPSLTHAAAAAILRNAHLTRSGDTPGRYAIDLSSSRVRSALWLLDAVRAGQPLAAVFGYLIERSLDEAKLQAYKEPLRAQYPMPGLVAAPPETPSETIAARDVVNGWTFYQATDPLAQLTISPGDGSALEAIVRRLREVADAVADLLTADAVHQLVSGGTVSAASSLDALSKGARPPEPAIAHTPRGGTTLTHRIAVTLDAQASAAVAGWAMTERATAEPALNAWVGKLLGDPTTVRCRTTYFAPRPGDPEHREPHDVDLSKLGLAPLDVLALAQGAATGAAAASELDRRIAFFVLGAAPEGSNVQVTYQADPSWDRATIRTFPELLEVARAVGVMLGSARPMRPEDLVLPEGALAVHDADRRLPDAVARAATARGALETARNLLFGAQRDVLSGAVAGLDGLRDALMAAAEFGFPAAVPGSRKGATPELEQELLGRARSVLRDADERLKREATLTDPEERVAAIFDSSVILVPAFDVVGAAELGQALGAAPAFVGGAFQAMKWFQGAARVHAGAGRLRRVSLYASALGTALPPFEVAQLPYQPGGRWVALPFPSEAERPPSGRVSIVLVRPAPRPLDVPWAGLVIDEWSESIPCLSEQTGLGFHYDDPGAEAAQAVLVAVPPGSEAHWDLASLLATVNETFDLAKLRCVDRDLTPELAQLLPAIYLASNPAGETIETDLAAQRIEDPVILPAVLT